MLRMLYGVMLIAALAAVGFHARGIDAPPPVSFSQTAAPVVAVAVKAAACECPPTITKKKEGGIAKKKIAKKKHAPHRHHRKPHKHHTSHSHSHHHSGPHHKISPAAASLHLTGPPGCC
jgi:hypothetical protein